MLCIIPVRHDQKIKREVLSGIVSQTVLLDVHVHAMAPICSADVREISININRNQLRGNIGHIDEEFVLLLDSDVVMTDPSSVESMVDYLTGNPDIGCVAIDTKGGNCDPTHVITACAVIRTKDYIRVNYLSSATQCQCMLISNVTKSRYLTNIAAKEI